MTFLELYGVELTRELATTDTTVRFTLVRRKAAINAAQLEWNKRTHCLTKQTTLAIVDGTQEYDIEATVSDFGGLSAQGVSIKIVGTSTTRYIEGDDLVETTVERLNVEEPGWRAASAGTPRQVYLRQDGGARYFGLHPAPDVGSGETWTVILPYWVIPADLSADADEPFTLSSNILKSIRPYHRGLVHYAAYDLEKFRKDLNRGATQLQLFEQYVAEYQDAQKPERGMRVRMVRDYRGDASGRAVRYYNPRT